MSSEPIDWTAHVATVDQDSEAENASEPSPILPAEAIVAMPSTDELEALRATRIPAPTPAAPAASTVDDEIKELEEHEKRVFWEAKALRARREAKRLVDAEDASHDVLGEPVVRRVSDALLRTLPKTRWSIEGLLCAGGRAVFGGYRKAGKSTAVLNLLAAWAAGGTFLGEFKCAPMPDEGNVVWLNLELPEDTADGWIQSLVWGREAARVVAFHMRGRIPNITTAHGFRKMVDLLTEARCVRLVVDPVSPFMSACGLSNLDELDVQTFLNTWERIALEVGIEEIVYVAHVSKSDAKQNDGDDTVMGHGRWEAAADAIWIMGREKESRHAWFKAEGRDVDVPNVLLDFDPVTRALRTGSGSMRDAQMESKVAEVEAVVRENPGIKKGALTGHVGITGNVQAKTAAVQEALSRGVIVVVMVGTHQTHYAPDVVPGGRSTSLE